MFTVSSLDLSRNSHLNDTREGVKMARKRQVGVALDDRLREELEASAEALGRNISDEIRSRLERTIEQDRHMPRIRGSVDQLRNNEFEIIRLLVRQRELEYLFDRPTQELGDDVIRLAHDVGVPEAEWHQHPAVHAALVEAINTWLNAIKPSEENKDISQQMKQRGYDPQSMGRTVAHIRFRNKQDRMYREKELAQEGLRLQGQLDKLKEQVDKREKKDKPKS
jgi:hypothetical protein